MVKSIRPSRNERVRVVYARYDQRALSAERNATVHFSQAERGARQRGRCNNTTYNRSQARRRQPQIHDERFGWQSKTNFPYVSVLLEIFFFVFTAFKHSSFISSFVFFLDLIWYCVNHIHGSFRSEFITGNWRVLDKKRVPEPGSYTMNWLHQGKVNASVWMEDCSFECNSALLFFYSRLHCYILYFENCIFNSQIYICKSYV